jgi:hypothetical protein
LVRTSIECAACPSYPQFVAIQPFPIHLGIRCVQIEAVGAGDQRYCLEEVGSRVIHHVGLYACSLTITAIEMLAWWYSISFRSVQFIHFAVCLDRWTL